MSRYPGGIITKNPITPAGPNPTGAAPGVWRLNDVAYWRKQGLWPDASADRYWPYTSLLLSTTALGNANNNLFVDSSGAFNPVSRFGNTTQGSFTPYGSYWSNYFDGSGDYLTAPANAAFQLTGDFTVEAWIYPTAINTIGMIFGSENGAPSDYLGITSTRLVMAISAPSSPSYPEWSYTFALNQWYHVAVTRSGSTLRAFVNGTQLTLASGSATNSQQFFVSGVPVSIGRYGYTTSPYYFVGYISNVRIVKGTAVYTADFTPPAAPLTAISGTSLLTCQSNRFIDNSSNAFAITVNGDTKVQKFSPFTLAAPGVSYNQSDITNWSGYFDGSGDYLTTPTLATIGSGDFSQEAWVFASSTSGTPLIWDAGVGAGTFLLINGTTSILGGINGTTALTATYTLPTNQWTHLVYCRSGTTLSIYANGTRIATGTVSTSAASASYNIGAAKDVTRFFTGYISNLRFVTGSSAYDATQATITVPTTSLTAISGTSLLTLQNAAFTDNSTNNFVITQNGNTTVTGNSPFNTAGYWSTYFNGSSSYLSVPVSSSAFTLPGDFTLEAWVYRAASGYVTIFDTRSGGNYTDWVVGVNSSGQYDFVTVGGPGVRITTTETVPANTWTHTACVRQGSTVKVYLNGVASANTATYSSTITPATTVAWIGTSKDPVSSTGYVSSLRLVKGTAVYTSNFTPPTAPLTAISGTSLLICQNGQFIDNSSNAFTVTPNNSPQVQSFNPFYTSTIASNGGSMYFDGSGDYVQVPDSPALNLSGGVYTVEAWIWTTGNYSNYRTIITKRQNSSSNTCWQIYLNITTGVLSAALGTTGYNSSVTPTANCWNHVALVYDGTNANLYLNGSRVLQTAATNTNYASSPVSIGSYPSYGEDFIGYISGVRVLKNVQAYTGTSYTVPTAPANPTAATTLLLNGMNAGIYDATTINDMETVGNAQVSTVQSKYGGSSMYFDGSGDYLVLPATPTIAFGTGAFTVEGWVYVSAYSYNGLFSSWNAAATGVGVLLGLDNAGKPQFSIGNANTGANESITGASAIPLNTWTHLAATKTAGSGGTMRLFVNGVSVGTTTTTRSVERTVAVVGRYYQDTNNYYLNGYIDDLRVTNGVARYTANFTPPTAAFPTY